MSLLFSELWLISLFTQSFFTESAFLQHWMILGCSVPLLLFRAVYLTGLSHEEDRPPAVLTGWSMGFPIGCLSTDQAGEPRGAK